MLYQQATDVKTNLNVYSPEHLLEQAATAQDHLGYKVLHFYVNADGSLAREVTETMAVFYYLPSGGTLRDSRLNLVLYSARFDAHKGFSKS